VRLSDFDFPLPEGLVAQAPVTPRDASRLMVLAPEGALAHRGFADLPELLAPGDLLVFNDTRVIPARLLGHKASGGKVELLLCEPLEGGLGRRWRAMGQASKPIREGAALAFDGLEARVDAGEGEGFYRVTLDRQGAELEAALGRAGRIPLPPYIRRAPDAEDAARYQTIWARAPGSAAAPTAGLHFTTELMRSLETYGLRFAKVTLHVGLDTLNPVTETDPNEHKIHTEWCEVTEETTELINQTRASGGKIVAVGTTSVRTLESSALASPVPGRAVPISGSTGLYILPGFQFKMVDALITNFHLPKSTLLMLVSAFAGREFMLNAYAEAVRREYRFYSFGDAMLIL
jgi:S-adenosylmethionine:tRNA ribosyltransferase-isomerase